MHAKISNLAGHAGSLGNGHGGYNEDDQRQPLHYNLPSLVFSVFSIISTWQMAAERRSLVDAESDELLSPGRRIDRNQEVYYFNLNCLRTQI